MFVRTFPQRSATHTLCHSVRCRKNLCPECVAARDFEGFEELPIVPDIVSLGKSMGLEISEEDVN